MPMGNQVLKPNTKVETVNYASNGIVKKAVLFAINYTGTDNELNGCINDSQNLRAFLLDNKYFEENEITMLNDFEKGELFPTKENMLKQFDNIVEFANAHPNELVLLFVSYSGHGYYIRDVSGDEADGRDEVLCPIDCMSKGNDGFIVDDEIKSRLVDKLAENVMSDSCHSGSVLDLKYEYKFGKTPYCSTNKKVKTTKCDVALISGCKDTQTSADAYIPNKENNYLYQGAMTASFIKNFHDEISYTDLINGMCKWLKENQFTQIPQLSTGKKVDLKKPFLISGYNDK